MTTTEIVKRKIKLLEHIMKWSEDRYAERRTIQRIADKLKIHPSTASRLLRELTIHDFIYSKLIRSKGHKRKIKCFSITEKGQKELELLKAKIKKNEDITPTTRKIKEKIIAWLQKREIKFEEQIREDADISLRVYYERIPGIKTFLVNVVMFKHTDVLIVVLPIIVSDIHFVKLENLITTSPNSYYSLIKEINSIAFNAMCSISYIEEETRGVIQKILLGYRIFDDSITEKSFIRTIDSLSACAIAIISAIQKIISEK